MDVLHVIQCTNLGGMEHSALLMMRKLAQRGHKWRLVSLNPIGGLRPLLERLGVRYVGLNYRGWGGWLSLTQMYRAFRAEPADAILMTGHNVGAMLAVGGLCRGHRILFIHYPHAGVKPAWQWRLIYRLACRRFDAICFVSDFIRREAEAIYPPLRALSRTVRNPYELLDLPTAEERAAARSSLGLPPDASVVGNAGWLIEGKRWDVFLRVAKLVAAEIPDSAFLIAGDGPLRERLEELARELGVADRVRWLGWQQDLSPFYRSVDVILFSTDRDAAPRTPLEGIAGGVPVVASASNSGLDEMISGPAYGFLNAEHDIAWLADKVILLLLDRQLGRKITLAARARLAELSSPEKCGDLLEQMLGSNVSSQQDCLKSVG